ncbi:MAG: hypothetical protein H6Q99_1956 [Proteobacteria bacterium]|nr:hypothetical protein [Pseudomonadota bacterium]
MIRIAAVVALHTINTCLVTQPAGAVTPSFDCDVIHSKVEKLICGNDTLATLDMSLATRFARVLAHASADGVAGLRADQRTWRIGMLRCAEAEQPLVCTGDAYRRRLDELQQPLVEDERPKFADPNQ